MNTKAFTSHSGCVSQMKAQFEKGETILTLGDNNGKVGIVISGEAYVAATDEEGREVVLEVLYKDDCFGEYIMMPSVSQYFYVVAATRCEVNFIDYKRVLFTCRKNCDNHNTLMRELLIMTARRAQTLSLHTNILSQHSIKDKLLMYLRSQEDLIGGGAFTLTMSLTKLADYLSADRSAMMREIKNLNEEGIIKSNGRVFEIIKK